MLRLTTIWLWPILMGLMVRGDHKVCSWKPSADNDPGYSCDDTLVWGSSREGDVVAFYRPASNAIVIPTPCGTGGYGDDPREGEHDCLSGSWVFCAHYSPGHQQCFGLYKFDDCDWPGHGKPDYIKVFYFGPNPPQPPRLVAKDW